MVIPAKIVSIVFLFMTVILALVQFAPMIRGSYEYDLSFLAFHLAIVLGAAFLLVRFDGRRPQNCSTPWYDALLSAIAMGSALYFATQGQRVVERIEGVDPVYTLDILCGSALVLTLLEACRRVSGAVLAGIAGVFVLYALYGNFLPEPAFHRGLTLARFIDAATMSTSGVFGQALGASVNMIYYFVFVGSFLSFSGAGKLFTDLAQGVTAGARGGTGKAAVVSSGLFGMISGSAVSNVMVSGLITIPLMKTSGFNARLAGAIEATASTGSQLAPPIMGAVAFVLADIVGIPYSTVVLAAVVPSVLYYLSLLTFIHFYSIRHDLPIQERDNVRAFFSKIMRRIHLIVPLILMLSLLYQQYSIMYVGFWTLISIVAIASLRPETRMTIRDLGDAMMGAMRAVMDVTIPCAVAGLIVLILVQSGVGFKLQYGVIQMADGSLFWSLLGAMFMTLIFGMGMPTVAAYMITAILVAPTLQDLGVPALNAHMFILYFSVLSMVTPPVALSAYAAAGISGGRIWGTGVVAFFLALPGFIIPFAFVYRPELLLTEGIIQALPVMCSTTIGILAIAASAAGALRQSLGPITRIVMLAFGMCLVAPESTTDLIGYIGLLFVVGLDFFLKRRSGLKIQS